MVNIDRYDLPTRGIQVGMKIENWADISDELVASIGIVKQSNEMLCDPLEEMICFVQAEPFA